MPVHGLINARMITLYYLDMVWQQKQREEHQNHKAIPDGERSNKSTMRKPGIPPARIPEITWRKPSRHNSSYSHFEAKNDKAVSQREWSNIFFSKKVFFVFSIAADLALRLDQWEKRLNRVQKEKKQNQPKQNKHKTNKQKQPTKQTQRLLQWPFLPKLAQL